MVISLEVAPLAEASDTAFHELDLFHVHECGSEKLMKHRNPATDRYTLQCICGLKILLGSTETQVEIIHAAIDTQMRTLRAPEIQTNRSGSVTITAHKR